jgi:hypothetical protein
MVNSAQSMDYCKNVLPIPQFEGTCWFNALLMSLFYSELMRNFFIKELPLIRQKLSKQPKVIEILEDLLFNNYKVNDKNNQNFYNTLRPENILKQLNKVDKSIFYIDEEWIKDGWDGSLYIDQLFRFFDIKNKVLYLNLKKDYYDMSNKNAHITSVKKTSNGVWDIEWELLTRLSEKSSYNKFKSLNSKKSMQMKKSKLYSMPDDIDIINLDTSIDDHPPEEIQFKNATFILDSLFLNNFNNTVCNQNHQLAGITCKSKKYLYNGWTVKTKDPAMMKNENMLFKAVFEKRKELDDLKKERLNLTTNMKTIFKGDFLSHISTISKQIENKSEEVKKLEQKFKQQYDENEKLKKNPKPCNLVKYDWNKEDSNFCIDIKNCTYPKTSSDADLCYNVKKGHRSYLYVRTTMKNVDTESAKESTKELSKKRETNVKPQQPLKRKKTSQPSNDKEKICPPNQILNPATKRCVSRKGKLGKELIEYEKKQTPPHKSPSPVKSPEKPSKPSSPIQNKDKEKTCPLDQILNPATKRCVSKKGVIGKKLLAGLGK